MAVKTATNWYSSSIVGVPGIGADINVLETNVTPKFAVGFGFERADGAKYRYVHYGEATVAGKIVSQDVSESAVGYTDSNVVIHPSAAVAVPFEPNVNAGDIGSHYVQIRINRGFNALAGGYLTIASGRGLGYTYRIKSNTAWGTPSENNIRLQLYEPIKVALASETGISIVGNLWGNVEEATEGAVGTYGEAAVAGVAASYGSANHYGWVQTKGVASVLTSAETGSAIGFMVGLSTGTAGALAPFSFTTGTTFGGTPVIGFALNSASNGSYTSIYLNLE